MNEDPTVSIIENLRIHGNSDNLKPLTLRISRDLENEIRETVDDKNLRLSVVLRASVALGWKMIRDELEGV